MEYRIVNGELYHAGVKGQKWGVRRYQNKDGSLTPAGKKRYGNKTPDGWSVKRQNYQRETYNKWRNAKGSEKKQLKRELQKINNEGAKSMNDYRELIGLRKYPNRVVKRHVESGVIAGRKVRPNKYGDGGGYEAIMIPHMYDPNRRVKNASKRIAEAAVGGALIVFGNKAANSLYRSGKIDKVTAKMINSGSAIAGGFLAGGAGGRLIRDIRSEYYLKRYNKQVDKELKNNK